MPFPKKLLMRDEVVVRHMHTSAKALFWPIIGAIVLLAAAIAGTVLAPDSWSPWGLVAIWAVWAVLTVLVLIAPWIRWASTSYTVTSKRVITRAGVFHKTGHDLPLSRISDVQIDRAVTDRMFGCGTLSLQTSADDPLVLEDVPDPQTVQVEISNLLFHDVQGAVDADPDD